MRSKSYLEVKVRVNPDIDPELYGLLSSLSLRKRAGKLRALALRGLLTNSIQADTDVCHEHKKARTEATTTPNKEEDAPNLNERRMAAMQKTLNSI